LPGDSLVATFERDRSASRELFFHHEGNRALRSGDWKLVSSREGGGVWELYDLRSDRAESQDLAAKHPERVREMASRWRARDEEYVRQAMFETAKAGANR
jgi:arylsulfatase